jgi:Fe-Mn family superoxide dismutase
MSNNEKIGNYEVTKEGIVTRREVLIMGAVAAGSLASIGSAQAAGPAVAAANVTGKDPYVAKDFSALAGKLDGLTASQIDQHLKLYKGYIGKANEIHAKLQDADLTKPNTTYAPLRELLMELLKASGKCMRGWVIVGYNTRGGYIDTFGLDMHNMWAPASTVPLLVLDVYEHAYMIDYGIDRAKYLDAFAKNLDWNVVGKRLTMAKKHPTGHDSTV